VWVADCANRSNSVLYKLIRNSSMGSKLPNIKYEYLTHMCASGIETPYPTLLWEESTNIKLVINNFKYSAQWKIKKCGSCVCVYQTPVEYVAWYIGIQQMRSVQCKAPHVSELKMLSIFSSLSINATINEKWDVLEGIGKVCSIKKYSSIHSLRTK
jgi:hypothetical protein